uniref:EGF-like domain-containing protein n=1 Tax=Ditylenchus dipsaci TaxID=166011 RepID=A0A915ECB8_9BILA
MASVQLPLPSLAGQNKPSIPDVDLNTRPATNINNSSSENKSSHKLMPPEPKSVNFWQPEDTLDPRLRKFQKDEPVLVGKILQHNDEKVKKLDGEKETVLVAKYLPPHQPTVSIKTGQISNEGLQLLQNQHTEIGTAIFSSVWENMKKMMGFSPDCLHGGHKNLRGNCVCPKYYEGNLCESIICANNGTRKKAPLSFTEEMCVCPYPDFITGKHCETLRCHNGGKDLGNGHCSCVDGWYSGQFCQFYTSSWLVAVGLPLLGIAMIIISQDGKEDNAVETKQVNKEDNRREVEVIKDLVLVGQLIDQHNWRLTIPVCECGSGSFNTRTELDYTGKLVK